MAGGSRQGGDMVLGGRHLVGIFLLLVVMLGVVFTLGYLLGRNQYDAQLRAAAGEPPLPVATKPREPVATKADAPKSAEAASRKNSAPSAPAPSPDWDFYHSAEPAKPAAVTKPAPKPAPKQQVLTAANRPPAKPPAATPAKPAAHPAVAAASAGVAKPANAPLVPRGSTVLQVAALVREADALALAQALQQKKFPAFVLSPDTDNFYRVQVGPYNDAASATAARTRLESQGFKSIIKR